MSNEVSLYDTLDAGAKNKLAQLVTAQMPTAMMADFLGISLSDMHELLNAPELKQLVAKRDAQERLEQLDSSTNWNKVEALALRSIIAELNSAPDAEFALRAAQAANKATRTHRGSNTIGALNGSDSAGAGRVITLQLNQQVVQNIVAPPTFSNAPTEPKVLDVFTSKQMERLTQGLGITGANELEAYFEEVPDANLNNPLSIPGVDKGASKGVGMGAEVDALIDGGNKV